MENSIAMGYKENFNNVSTIPQKILDARKNFWCYCKLINPKFFRDDRPHLKEIADTLQAIYERRVIKLKPEDNWAIISEANKQAVDQDGINYQVCLNLMLNIPPRHGKSYTVSLFVDWTFGKDIENRVIAVTYNEILAGRFSTNVRDGIDATKVDNKITIFNDIFPDVHIKYGDSAKGMWSLEGQYFSYLGTGFGGTLTGVGCKVGIIDDPIKGHKEAFNDDFLKEQYAWYTNTYLSRVEEGGIYIIIMTRWSSKDLCGRLLAEEDGGDWYELKMQACLDEEKGIMLCPAIFSFNSYLKKKSKTTAAIFLANYQQEPVDMQGALYKSFMVYDRVPLDEEGNPLFEIIKAYCDTADTGSDYLCNIIYGVYDMEAYILDVIFTPDQMEETETAVAAAYHKYNVNEADIESNNGGRGFARAVLRILKEVFHTNHTVINDFFQSANKIARIKSNATYVQQHIYYPVNWMHRWPEYYQSMVTYQADKKNAHDDAQDCTTGVAEKMEAGVDDWLY